jgi:hypothetical protein
MIIVEPGRRGMGESTQWTTAAPDEPSPGDRTSEQRVIQRPRSQRLDPVLFAIEATA